MDLTIKYPMKQTPRRSFPISKPSQSVLVMGLVAGFTIPMLKEWMVSVSSKLASAKAEIKLRFLQELVFNPYLCFVKLYIIVNITSKKIKLSMWMGLDSNLSPDDTIDGKFDPNLLWYWLATRLWTIKNIKTTTKLIAKLSTIDFFSN